MYYGLKGKDASYYKVKYKGQEKKIFIDKDYILDVYANDENLFSDYCARVFNDKDESICIF